MNMDIKRGVNFNFVLFLCVFFALFAMILFGLQEYQVRRESRVQGVYGSGERDDHLKWAEKFGMVGGQLKVSQDPVLGRQSIWGKEAVSLVVNDVHVIYRDGGAKVGRVTGSKLLQDTAVEYLNKLGLDGDVVLDFEKSKLLAADSGEIFEVDKGKEGDATILEVTFVDIANGEDRIRVWVTGAGEIFEVIFIR